MRILLIGDFGGKFPRELEVKLGSEDFDLVLCQGDLANIKQISATFKKYGKDYEKILGKGKTEKIRIQGVKDAEQPLRKLNSLGKPVYLVRGNNEFVKYKEFRRLATRFRNLKLIDYKLVNLGLLSVIGYPYEPPPNERKDLKGLLKRFHKWIGLFDPRRTILLTHYPPYNCDLDRIPENAQYAAGSHIGSKVVEKLILEYDFPIVVCGHLEEYQDECIKGKTRIINPGAGDLAKYAILEVKDSVSKAKVKFK